jgi:hypothetical protein
MTVILELAEGEDMRRALGALVVAALLAGCGNAQGSDDGEQTAARSDSTLACSEYTSMDIDYLSSAEGNATPELAAGSFAKDGQIVKITSRSDHDATFTIKNSSGDLRAKGTLIEHHGRWLIEHLATCDPVS